MNEARLWWGLGDAAAVATVIWRALLILGNSYVRLLAVFGALWLLSVYYKDHGPFLAQETIPDAFAFWLALEAFAAIFTQRLLNLCAAIGITVGVAVGYNLSL